MRYNLAMEKEERIVKHLEMILRVIERMARNSFMLKTWAVTLTAASLWLLARMEEDIGKMGVIVVVVNISFWGLDGYFLRQERLFRKLYNQIRSQEDSDFSMDTRPFSEQVPDIWHTCVGDPSPNTLLRFYTPLLVVAGVVICY